MSMVVDVAVSRQDAACDVIYHHTQRGMLGRKQSCSKAAAVKQSVSLSLCKNMHILQDALSACRHMCQQAEPMAKAGQTLVGQSTPPSRRLVGTR